MCEVRTKSIQPFTSYRYYYDFIMSIGPHRSMYTIGVSNPGALHAPL